MSEITNNNIVEMLNNRSVLAFEFIYKSYYNDLLNFAYSYLMNRGHAEDLVHDVYSKIWENCNSLPPINNIKTYLFSMVKNACMNHFKHLNVIDNNQNRVIEAILFSDTYSYIDNEEIIAKVNRCIEKLPSAQQLIMKMRYVDHMNYAIIASELGISPETVHTHIKRAFKFFKENYSFFQFIVPIF